MKDIGRRRSEVEYVGKYVGAGGSKC